MFGLDGGKAGKRFIMLPLEAGMHDVSLVYFEEFEDQELELTLKDKGFEPLPMQLFLLK